ncbi:MAG: hypothetical protein ACRDQA_30025 [Nocardioidaceae bacterium]
MSVTDEVFIAADQPIEAVLARLRDRLDRGELRYAEDTGTPYLMLEDVDIYVRRHEFPDDEDAPLSEYPYMVEIRHLDGDAGEQEKIAHVVFDAARSEGWRALCFHDMQVIVEGYDPGRVVRAS